VDWGSDGGKIAAITVQGKSSVAVCGKHGSTYYKQLLEQNKQYIQEPPTVEKCNLLSKQLFYTRLASIPGRTETFWKELDFVKNAWKNRKDLKVEDAGIAALFGLECFAWFCAGEIVEGDLHSLVTIHEKNHRVGKSAGEIDISYLYGFFQTFRVI
ncbi:hypothetical protein C3L33_03580, partial [Rhododendron williamsianum]